MRPILCLILLLLSCTCRADKERHWLFYGGAGYTYSIAGGNRYTANYALTMSNGFRLQPFAGIAWIHAIRGRFGFETGFAYTQRGFRTLEHVVFRIDGHTQKVFWDERYKLDYFSIPLMLSYRLMDAGTGKITLAAGMRYNFLLRSRRDIYSIQITDVQEPSEYFIENNPVYKGLLQTVNTAPGTLSIFDTGVRLQADYTWRSRLSVRLFYEHSLYSVYLKELPNNTPVRLRYGGLSLGILL